MQAWRAGPQLWKAAVRSHPRCFGSPAPSSRRTSQIPASTTVGTPVSTVSAPIYGLLSRRPEQTKTLTNTPSLYRRGNQRSESQRCLTKAAWCENSTETSLTPGWGGGAAFVFQLQWLPLCVSLTRLQGCPDSWSDTISGDVCEGVSGRHWHLNQRVE